MAKAKTPEGLKTVKLTTAELVTLALNIETVFAEGIFGWTADRKLSKIGELAKQAVEYKIGEELVASRKSRLAIEDEYRKPYEGIERTDEGDAEYRRKLEADVKYVALFKKEQSLWEEEVPDFSFVPVEVKIPNDVHKKIKKSERTVIYRDKPYTLEVYAALGFLVEKGYIIET